MFSARLPFKRLNPEPKDSQESKRPRTPLCLEAAASDGENEAEPSPVSVRNGPALVNGRGPLDGFFSRGSASAENVCIDLTGDSPVKRPSKPDAPAPVCVPSEGKKPNTNKQITTGNSKNGSNSLPSKTCTSDSKVVSEAENESESEAEEEDESDLEESTTQLDTTQDSESEGEEQDESMKADMSGPENESMVSPSSVESSPEQAKNESLTSTVSTISTSSTSLGHLIKMSMV